MQGRRRDNTILGELPADIQAGDYWRVVDRNGDPIHEHAADGRNLDTWMVAAPMPSGSFGIGRLVFHTVREHEDGTITVAPGDGSSNSILLKGAAGQEFHGYIDHGRWYPA